MEISEEIQLNTLHHAYLLETDRDEGLRVVRALMEDFGITTKGNPDYYEYIFDVFLLEHAHLLRERQSFRGSEGAKKIFLVSFNSILSEAQNALLKTLEEPTDGTHFFFITKSRAHLFPTVLSRMQVIADNRDSTPQPPVGIGEKFIHASIPERLDMIAPLIKAKGDDKSEAKEDARTLLRNLERALVKRIEIGVKSHDNKKGIDAWTKALASVVRGERILAERSPSLKLVFEHLALTIPHPERVPIGEKKVV